MKIAQLITLFSAVLLFTNIGVAQNKYTAEADMLFETGNYTTAASKYILAETKTSGVEDKGFLFYRIAECYRLSKQADEAEKWYEKAATAQFYKVDPESLFNYGRVLAEQNKWDKAIVQYNKYIEKGGNKSKGDKAIKASQDAADLASGIKKDGMKARYVVENASELNSASFDYSPMWASKKQDDLVFTSGRQSSTGKGTDEILGESFTDIFFTTQDKKGKWSTPAPITNTVDTEANEGSPAYDKDYGVLYFTRCDYNDKGRFGCDIMSSKKSGDNYQAPVNLNLLDRTGGDDSSRVGHPALTPDDKYMIFASNMPGGKGGRDLWYSTYDKKTDTWGKPVNMKEINTPGDEMFPYVHPDGSLYFSSTSYDGLGGLDIFRAEKTGDISFGTPTNIGYPINSSSDDFGIIFVKDKNDGFFSSNRPGGKGKDDIYMFREPPVEICFQGVVYDKQTGATLPNTSVNISVAPDGKAYPITTDGNGGFSLCKNELKPNDVLTIALSRDKYIASSDKVSTGNAKESITINREYFLEPIVENKTYDLPEVRYDFNKSELQVNSEVNSKDSLNTLYDLMVQNPTFKIQLESHTDARGSDADNLKLSQARAEACVRYLVDEKKIDPGRLVAKGMGEKEPRLLSKDIAPFKKGDKLTEAYIATLATEELRERAHQLNRRTVFKIVDQNYKPKN